MKYKLLTHLWPFSKSKFNLKSDRVNLVAPASPIECLLYLPNVRAIQYKLGPERFTRHGNSNVQQLPVFCLIKHECDVYVFLIFFFGVFFESGLRICAAEQGITYGQENNWQYFHHYYLEKVGKCTVVN